jgi:hypothetical protein
MKTLINKNTQVSYYLVKDTDNVVFHSTHVKLPNLHICDLNTANAELVSVDSVPTDWKGGEYRMYKGELIPNVDIDNLAIEDVKAEKLTELKIAVRQLYVEIQAYVIEKQIHDETIPTVIKDKIKSVRTKYNQIKAEINAMGTVLQLVKYRLPYAAIDNLREQLKTIE